MGTIESLTSVSVGGVALVLAGTTLVASLIEFVLYGIDKSAAKRGAWRIPEKTLLFVAALGGWIGALAGARVFRHKTRKQPFVTLVFIAAALHVAACVGLLIWAGVGRSTPS